MCQFEFFLSISRANKRNTSLSRGGSTKWGWVYINRSYKSRRHSPEFRPTDKHGFVNHRSSLRFLWHKESKVRIRRMVARLLKDCMLLAFYFQCESDVVAKSARWQNVAWVIGRWVQVFHFRRFKQSTNYLYSFRNLLYSHLQIVPVICSGQSRTLRTKYLSASVPNCQ